MKPSSYDQLSLFTESQAPSSSQRQDTSTTFVPNQDVPVHRWFRYSAGFSGAWAYEEIQTYCGSAYSLVLDPFAGCGTTLIAAQQRGVPSVGIEAHPLVFRVAKAKLYWTSDPKSFQSLAYRVLERARACPTDKPTDLPSLLSKIYAPYSLSRLYALAASLSDLSVGQPEAPSELAWLALLSILRSCAHANTAPWQYVLPKRQKLKVLDPFEAFEAQVRLMVSDMYVLQRNVRSPGQASMILGDARTCEGIADETVDFVLTSPPYPNNYDYADATRVELTFLGEVQRWADLHDVVRKQLIISCSQHARKENLHLPQLLGNPAVDVIRDELTEVCQELARIRLERAGKKSYHTMIAAYFVDMARVLRALARVVRPGGVACFVVGDSAPYGVHVPVERWLGSLAEVVGFEILRFEETRKRNVKWKNRKHRVPLHEGRLWLRRV